MIREPVRVQLELESHPENVALVRAALAGFADVAQLQAELASDLQTAVSEACNNVVVHAYPGGTGPMLIRLLATHDTIEVTVTDSGRGITRISGGDDHMGLGLAVISSLAARSEFRNPEHGGTEVSICFRHHSAVLSAVPDADLAGFADADAWPELSHARQPVGHVIAWVSPVDLARSVIGRVFRAAAAASHFSVTRFTDLYAINDAIAEYAELASDDGLSIAIASARRRLSVTGGPFVPAIPGAEDGSTVTAQRAREIASRRRSLAAVVDALSTESVGDQELLHLTLVDSSRDGG